MAWNSGNSCAQSMALVLVNFFFKTFLQKSRPKDSNFCDRLIKCFVILQYSVRFCNDYRDRSVIIEQALHFFWQIKRLKSTLQPPMNPSKGDSAILKGKWSWTRSPIRVKHSSNSASDKQFKTLSHDWERLAKKCPCDLHVKRSKTHRWSVCIKFWD